MTKRTPNPKAFTDMWLRALKQKAKQYVVWDHVSKRGIGQIGLSVLVSPGGTKRFRALYYVNGKAMAKKLGRVGEMDLGTARKLTAELRGMASEGRDPKEEERKARVKVAEAQTFGEIADLFIENFAKPRQRTWDQTERVLKTTCEAWLEKPIGTITKADAYTLLEGFVAEGKPAKARIALV